MNIRMLDDDTSYSGAPVDIARELRARSHMRTRDLDGYMQKIATEYGFDLDGDTLEERCDAFLVGLIRDGTARPVFTGKVGMHAVRILRKVLGLSRDKLAQLLNVAPMTVNRWETGEHAISSDRFEGIKRVLFDPAANSTPLPEPEMATAQPASDDSLMGIRQRVRKQARSMPSQSTSMRSVQLWRA